MVKENWGLLTKKEYEDIWHVKLKNPYVVIHMKKNNTMQPVKTFTTVDESFKYIYSKRKRR
jgi:hypothetical protein